MKPIFRELDKNIIKQWTHDLFTYKFEQIGPKIDQINW